MAASTTCMTRLSAHTASLSALKGPSSSASSYRSQARPYTCMGCKTSLQSSFLAGGSSVLHPVDKQSWKCRQTPQLHRVAVRAAGGSGGREPWDFSRFLKTVLYFNEPPKLEEVISTVTNPSKLMEALGSVLGSGQQQSNRSRGGRGKVLVVGATGGVGKRVVDELRKNGVSVVALVRDEGKARQLLGSPSPGLQIVTGEITQPRTLLPEYFDGVSAVINASAAIVGPKEGDTAERAKYYQGIKFYDPEIKENTPEAVEFRGVQNVVEAVKEHLGYREGKTLFQIGENGLPSGPAWGALDDVVMGGISESGFQVDRRGGEDGSTVGVFRGFVSCKNSGGFASIRTRNFTPPLNLSPYEGLALRLKGTGKRYKFIIRTDEGWDTVGYTKSFDTQADTWQTVHLPFSEFLPVFRAKTVTDKPPLNPATVYSFQLMFSKFESDGELNPTYEDGPFELPVASIKAYLKEPISPKFVHVGSAGVTRPGRPGLDLDKQPPAVRMNDELGGLLTYKLKGEDVIRSSGIPYTIIRPCALTEEPAGAELQFDQGDNITGKIGRAEVARICVAALASPEALDKTFEVKSTVPFSVPFEVDPTKPPAPQDYTPYFSGLQEGVTGKLEERETATARA